MRPVRIYRIIIDFFDKKLPFTVRHYAHKNNVTIYELKCGGINYVVINEKENWDFLANMTPCEEFKEVIVASLICKRKKIVA